MWEVGELGDDKHRYWQLVVNLADEMEKQGLGIERVRQIAETLSEWLRRGL